MERVSLRRVTLYVALSRNEGFGLTPLDAQASKTAVVASDAGAYKELVTEGTGTVVPAGDGRALTDAIKPYLEALKRPLPWAKKPWSMCKKTFPLIKKQARLTKFIRNFSQKNSAIVL